MTPKKKLIEVTLSLEAVNIASAREIHSPWTQALTGQAMIKTNMKASTK